MIRIEHNPTRRQLTVFGWLWLVFFGILGGTSWWKTGAYETAGALWAMGAVVPAIGRVWPSTLRIVYLAASYATFPIGFVFSYVVLAVVYYLIVTPIGLVMRLMGRDPMQRRFDPGATTYWTPRKQEEGTERYFRQF
jgi:hypothetical protein